MRARVRRFLSVSPSQLRRPYFLGSVAVLAVWLFVNSDARLLGFDLVSSLWQDAQLAGPGVTPILLYATYPASVALVAAAVYLLREERLLSFFYAASTPVLAIVLFENLWHLFGWFAPTFPAHLRNVNGAGYLILGTWSAFGLITVRYWTLGPIQGATLAAYLGLWFAWYFSGYPQLVTGSDVAYAFNFLLKGLSFVVVGLLLLSPTRGTGPAEDVGTAPLGPAHLEGAGPDDEPPVGPRRKVPAPRVRAVARTGFGRRDRSVGGP